ncbi:hypothetical protein TREAZ_1569 [Leadbettera azotonutricia ZAS-9]|uniref:Uncharacterized protein n=2 Tax=Leadbettera azotonutricia TaxID=150829 RepID=F5YDY6_LEAAZ|nr:hypothetical protein TREAZ_1569 [Leadbettera azotonutricia ZAS-9]
MPDRFKILFKRQNMKKHTIFGLALPVLLAVLALGGCSTDGDSNSRDSGILTISNMPTVTSASIYILDQNVTLTSVPQTILGGAVATATKPLPNSTESITLTEGLLPPQRFTATGDYSILIVTINPVFTVYKNNVHFDNGCLSISWNKLFEFGKGGTLSVADVPVNTISLFAYLTAQSISYEDKDNISNIITNPAAAGTGVISVESATVDLKTLSETLGFDKTGSYTVILSTGGVPSLFRNDVEFVDGSASISWNDLWDIGNYQYIVSVKDCANIEALTAFLKSAPPNTSSTPYKINISAGSLSDLIKDGDWLGGILSALNGHYISLDLGGVAGTAIPDSTSRPADDKIKSITLPAGITSIGANVLVNLTGLTGLTVNVVNPPVLAGSLGSGLTPSIYVPSASVVAYQNAETWKNYTIVAISSILP